MTLGRTGRATPEDFMFKRASAAVFLAVAPALFGCASPTLSAKPVRTEAELGRVVIYRNGVAYFERTAAVRDGELTLNVPAERVDDFLKSLTIQDARTGNSLPVSFPTLVEHGDEVTMRIKLPKPTPKELRVTYVTESPAWKPSYRLLLSPSGKAKLEAWAVVDNVSGEDWNNVKVGVGSTSALSFRYDLHSVRVVERETLGDPGVEGGAPPIGGSPYQVASGELQIIGNLRIDAVDQLKPQAAEPARGANTGQQHKLPDVTGLAARLKRSGQKVRIEGYARSSEKDGHGSSLDRANSVKETLVQNGVPAEQIEVVGTGKVSNRDGARVLALAGGTPKSDDKAAAAAPPSNDPVGSAYFVAPRPMTIKKDQSALVGILNTSANAQQVYYYDPISARGSKRFAFKAVRLDNPTHYTLDSGPFTIYADGHFLGEGLSEPIAPKSVAFIPFALDRKLIVETEHDTREEIDQLMTIERGIVTAESQRIRRTRLSLANQGETAARVYVRHRVAEGFALHDSKLKFEKLGGAHLFPVDLPARGTTMLVIEEAMPITKSVDIRGDAGIKEISLFLARRSRLDPELRQELEAVVVLHREMADEHQKLETLHAQMQEYRVRVDELNAQLVSLRRVPRADKLSRHLAQKMEEISDKLQKATIQATDLQSQLLARRVTLQDRLAELTLAHRKDPAKSASTAQSPGGA
jgi:hypothetical protein